MWDSRGAPGTGKVDRMSVLEDAFKEKKVGQMIDLIPSFRKFANPVSIVFVCSKVVTRFRSPLPA